MAHLAEELEHMKPIIMPRAKEIADQMIQEHDLIIAEIDKSTSTS